MQPPLLAEVVLRRVLRIARMDGLAVLWFATSVALSAAWQRDIASALVWLILAGAGAIELHGTVLLQQAHKRGLPWLVGSQILFIAVVLALCAHQLTHYDPTALRTALTAEMKTTLDQAHYDEEDFLLMVWHVTYGLIAGATLLCKGGLMVYYFRRRTAVNAAMEMAEVD